MKLQREQAEWCDRNFGKRQPHQPVLGLVEEWGEMLEAIRDGKQDAVDDAIADLAIFGSDVATSFDFELSAIVQEADMSDIPYHDVTTHVPIALGKIAHHLLKFQQGIRGTPELHLAKIREGLVSVFIALFFLAKTSSAGKTLEQLTGEVWEKVRARDWKKDAAHAGVGA